MSNISQYQLVQLQQALVSDALALGVFQRVNGHEARSAPGLKLSCEMWADSIRPYARGSGLAATTGIVTWMSRIRNAFLGGSGPEYDAIETDVMAATAALMGSYTGGFTLGGLVREVDLLGAAGTGLSASAGYVTQDGKQYRAMLVTVPLIVNDILAQEA